MFEGVKKCLKGGKAPDLKRTQKGGKWGGRKIWKKKKRILSNKKLGRTKNLNYPRWS